MTVWKTPICGCYKDWVIHLRKEGFHVVTNDLNDTAQVGGYVIEGYVSASEVKRLLREKPVAIGLAVPSMPVGSPGMEMPGGMSGARDAFDVVLVTADGSSRVYQSYTTQPSTKSSAES